MQVKIKHRQHANISVFVKNQTINIKNHIGYTDLETAEELVSGPFGYEFAEPPYKFNPETWTKDNKHIVWNTIMPFYEGYGYVGQMMITALTKIGVDVSVFLKGDHNYLTMEAMKALTKPKKYDAWGMWHHFWQQPGMLPFEKKAIYTMWESTQLRPEWIAPLNEVNLVFAPCEQNLETFRANGVTTPMAVISHGVDQTIYNYRPKQKNDKFRFGTMGSLEPRKNIDALIEAFSQEFHAEDDVELYIKDTNEDTYLRQKYGDRPKLIWNGQKISPVEVADLLASFDFAVFPSRGEGFGLGGLQAMAVGTTCACTDWGGFKEYLNPDYNYGIEYNLVDIKNFASNNTDYSGQWADIKVEHLREIMRYAYEHRDEMHEKGKQAAKWVKDFWTWERCAQQLVDTIDKYESGKL